MLLNRWRDAQLMESELLKSEEYKQLCAETKALVHEKYVSFYFWAGSCQLCKLESYLFKLYIITFRFTEACISSKGTNSNRAADSDRMNGAASTSRRDDRRGFGPVRGDRGFDNRAPPYQGGFERYRGGFGRGLFKIIALLLSAHLW